MKEALVVAGFFLFIGPMSYFSILAVGRFIAGKVDLKINEVTMNALRKK